MLMNILFNFIGLGLCYKACSRRKVGGQAIKIKKMFSTRCDLTSPNESAKYVEEFPKIKFVNEEIVGFGLKEFTHRSGYEIKTAKVVIDEEYRKNNKEFIYRRERSEDTNRENVNLIVNTNNCGYAPPTIGYN